ncbi:hypothetical protein I312_104373 [Cryptococcus bacillisporus CA1280]|uniref:NADH dehydrogenase [ubiquinone] 1 alpha subcomplex assembly factor 3 n=1 Tax=Cryptococcus bacillisporus CA1280 TaxID=1296109 RepID=A0A0D0UEY9_CRYGA|nr:hypothetical protein I312_03749 [Cryptococcus bacillisporus CA1280]
MTTFRYSIHVFRTYARPTTLSAARATSNTFPPRRCFQNILAPTDADANSPTLTISKLTPRGFILSDNLIIPGGAIFHSGKVLLWDVDPPKQLRAGEKGSLEKVWEGWEEERFGALEMLVPRPEILLLGTGERAWPAPKRLREYISSLGIQLDVMDSRNAASTYNLLVEEGRRVAAALCPLGPIDPRTGEPR